MGHYDDCYASDDYHSMTSREKQSYFKKFEKEFKKEGHVWGTFDDVGGWLLREWATRHHHKIKQGYKDLTVEVDDSLLDVASRIVGEKNEESNVGQERVAENSESESREAPRRVFKGIGWVPKYGYKNS